MQNKKGPKILVLDIETAPITAFTWGIYDQDISPNMIKNDWFIISFAAKFVGEKKIHQADLRKGTTQKQEVLLLKKLWDLMDAADIILGQNSQGFDIKKINARFIELGFKPPSPYQQIDTLKLAKKNFAFTSNKLEHLSKILNPDSKKKSEHSKFPGFKLWAECLKGNQAAWREMAKYNIQDVVATEALYKKLAPWGVAIKFNEFYGVDLVCQCGSQRFHKDGQRILKAGRMQRYRCKECGATHLVKIKKGKAA